MPYFLVQSPTDRDTPLEASGWEGAHNVLWTIGRKLPDSVPMRLSFRAEGPLDSVSDLPVNSLNVPLFSSRLWEAICGDEAAPADVLDVVLLDDWEAEVVQRSHVAINLRTLLSGCVDFDASDVEVAPWAPQHIMHARRLAVRCPAEVPAIFRLDEFVQIPLLSDAAAARVRSLEGLRGVEVVHVDDYRGAITASA